MRPWTVHGCTVHSWQSQLLRAEKKKKRKTQFQNVYTGIIVIQTVTYYEYEDFLGMKY